MPYNIFHHRHKFAVWAAARSVQRGWKKAKVLPLRNAIEKCGIREFLKDPSSLEINLQVFEKLHRQWCSSIQNYLQNISIETSYGRAAKLLAVYIKAMVIVAGEEQSSLAHVTHPPIDKILLNNLGTSYDLPKLRQITWTRLNNEEYYVLVDLLRSLSKGQPFWMLEEHWTVTDTGIESERKDEVQAGKVASPMNDEVEKNSEIIPPLEKSQILLCSADASPNAQSEVACEACHFFPRAKWVSAVRNSSERLGCDFAILTTGHGMVNPCDIIAPYDKHVDAFPEQVRENFERTISRLLDRKKYKLVIFYAGGVPRDSYLKILYPILQSYGVGILTFGRPNMFDVGKIDKIVHILTTGKGTKLCDIRSLLKVPGRLKLLK